MHIRNVFKLYTIFALYMIHVLFIVVIICQERFSYRDVATMVVEAESQLANDDDEDFTQDMLLSCYEDYEADIDLLNSVEEAIKLECIMYEENDADGTMWYGPNKTSFARSARSNSSLASSSFPCLQRRVATCCKSKASCLVSKLFLEEAATMKFAAC